MWHVQTAIKADLPEEPVKLPVLPAINVLMFANLMLSQLRITWHTLMQQSVHSAENVSTECPTNSIIELNFPPRKPKMEVQAEIINAIIQMFNH